MADDPRITQARERHTNGGLPAHRTLIEDVGALLAVLAEREQEIARLIAQWRKEARERPIQLTPADAIEICADQLEALALSERETTPAAHYGQETPRP